MNEYIDPGYAQPITDLFNNSELLVIMVLSICIQILIGLALATFIDIGGKKTTVFKVLWFIPLMMSSVAIGVIAWQFTPFYMVYCMAAYTNISEDAFEAARIDGCLYVQIFLFKI